MEDKYKLKPRGLIRIGTTVYFPIPPDCYDHLGIEFNQEEKPTTELTPMPDKSKWGKYLALYNAEQQEKERQNKK
jgi:hypothetical protein